MNLNFSGKITATGITKSKLFLTMKLTVLLIIAGCLQLSAKSYSQTITLTEKSATIEKVFAAVEKQSGYGFFYRYKDIAAASPVTVNLKDATLNEALLQLFKDQPLTYVIENKTIVVKKQPLAPVVKAAKQIIITGQVFDNQNQALTGVNVRVKGTNEGTVTDISGKYSISADENAVLVFSFVGFSTMEQPVNGKAMINVSLQTDNKLNEVVVVGYGNQSRRDVTGAVGTVKMANIAEIKVASLDLKLAGQLAGVTVNQVTGTPGGGVSINIRGAGSVGAGDDPLYVIDGFPLEPGFDQQQNPLSTINPDDIESINVLKDAASTAIYGSRGANGVILITTKRAKKGQSSIEFSTFTGVQTILPQSELKMMTAQQFAQWRIENQQDLDRIHGKVFDIDQVDPAYRNPAALGEGTNWYDAVTQVAPQQNYNVTVSNGTDKVRSLFTLGYFDQSGTILNTGFQRYSVRANMDADVAKNVTVGLDIAPTYSLRRQQETDGHFDSGVLSQAILESPLSPVKQPDGSYTQVIGSPGTFQNANPVSELVNTMNKYSQFRTLANFYADWKIIDGLDLKSTFGVDYQYSTGDYYRPSYLGGFNVASEQAAGSFNSAYSLNWLNENTINYHKKWGDHSLTLLGGYTIQQENDHSRLTYGTGYADDAVESINGATIVTASADDEAWRLLSFLSRAEYAYKDKYLLSASIRRDGSSRFAAAGHQWGTFPSVSAGWRISDESFFPKTNIIEEVKFTGSYGLAGNNAIGNYQSIAAIVPTNYSFGGGIAPGNSLGNLGNNQLTWEDTKQLDIGMDISLFKGRIYLIAEYYNRYTQDMLQDVDIPVVSGFSDAESNVGNVRNRGWEFTVNTKNIVGDKFNWSSDFNISFNRNKVLSLGTTPSIMEAPLNDNASSITEVGLPMGQFYGYQFAGIINNQKELASVPHFAGEKVGDILYKDINHDGVIDGSDEGPIGNPWPRFTFGFNNHFSYKAFDMNIVTAGSVGGHVFDVYKQFTTNLDGVFNVEQSVIQRWKSPGDHGDGIIPNSASGNTNLARDYFPSSWVESNTYLEVKDISLGYNFKTSFSKNLRLYIQAQNAILLTGYKGGNPEVGIDTGDDNRSLSPNVNFNAYPVSAVFTIGCNVTF
jgi:TonB-linked SusC/RagA family outer membrane protein